MDLFSIFEQQLKKNPAQDYLIALSGGLDSTALLALFKKYSENQPHFNLRAIHIHHGLSANADSWVKHCQSLCEQFYIPLVIEYVQVDRTKGIEAGAREARYQAIRRHILPNECLATAHHLNDQTETFFLALKRGSGLQGLSAMQPQSELFGMSIFRPLLNVTREQLENYAQAENLTWVHDESNDDSRYERNFLRNKILPKLRERWGHFDQTVQRSAQHCFEQQQLIDELLQDCFLEHCQTPTEFQLHNFLQYSYSKQTALLRMWLAQNQCEMPSKRQIEQLIQDVITAKKEANPQFHLGKKVIRRYQSCLYLTDNFADLSGICLEMQDSCLSLPDKLGKLYLQRTTENLIFSWQQYSVELPHTDLPIQIRFGYSGKIKRHPKRPKEDIKKIWQELQVPPWQRNRIPLIFYGDELQSAVGFFHISGNITK
ncbi:tRNA lysidine(34) synthetase TilS [Rodentibacter caecimuris]|uniref:tRNA(Ile)-lysidine synthase n=1 Tax=Rodentibacter caecimuris TaxID=1796644 RepID=A0AAJ3K5W2_9PAST|nr:tRNA lysidine(34) synthetase TilS [Rodentibacter heylii]AOF52540.1 tRNA(Ile)-lysidine synthetase [Pasteurellaceae bacterium NI1060]OOF73501.1 tRNA lysidine(34) synthetase TilS [Rodentibacter heylii]OOF73771.1 tRNA lysidine(34) synthetase TilS [Rodentibacter heylii]OOF76457.1 tRNA lysidine(34) synthetase TilS [Rodentibacter heylii]